MQLQEVLIYIPEPQKWYRIIKW